MNKKIYIEIEVKTVYGNEMYYPVNSAAHALADIAGSKTLTARVIIAAIDHLGCEVYELDSRRGVLALNRDFFTGGQS